LLIEVGQKRIEPIEQWQGIIERDFGAVIDAGLRAGEPPPSSVCTAYGRGVHLNTVCPSN
jgi:hypothetical protein